MHLTDYQTNPQLGSIRDGFGHGLVAAAEQNSQIVGLCADLTESTRMQFFKERFPERFIEVGVAEQNLVGVAAGLALGGKVPFAASYAEFSPGRSWEQIRVSVCYSNLNVKIVGGHAGLTVGPDGATHQCLEDIALMRVLPNMTVVVPCDEEEARKATLALAQFIGPSYLRSSREKSIKITTPATPFKIGEALTLKEGSDVTIIACGVMVAVALAAADSLAKQRIQAQVINLHTIKPLDTNAVIGAAQKTGAIVTVEEHQIAGGLGSAVAEVVSAYHPVPLIRVGMPDQFGESGEASALLEKYGLTTAVVEKATHQVLRLKKQRSDNL